MIGSPCYWLRPECVEAAKICRTLARPTHLRNAILERDRVKVSLGARSPLRYTTSSFSIPRWERLRRPQRVRDSSDIQVGMSSCPLTIGAVDRRHGSDELCTFDASRYKKGQPGQLQRPWGYCNIINTRSLPGVKKIERKLSTLSL